MNNSLQEYEQLERIAVVGIACRFPDASTVDQYWKNICNGVESVTSFTDEQLISAGLDPSLIKSPDYVKSGILLDDIDMFDANFFGFSPREAELTDPQHRIFLELAWEAMESSGYNPEVFPGRVGVFAGCSPNTYYYSNLISNSQAYRNIIGLRKLIATEREYLVTRVSYILNLRGPSILIQTACSTSLVAVHLACQSLLNSESDMALVGGVSINIPQISGYMYQEGTIESPDGHCRAFDASARGTVGGNGAGIVVLKRLHDALADGDNIRAVICSSAINNDGADKIGFTAPSVDGQAAVIAEAQALAGLNAEEITYIEAHGTGTQLGDPIEVAALTKAFRSSTDKVGFCAIGSVKPNIGHLDAAAGVAGLIKVILALENKMLPSTLHFKKPNPSIDFHNSPFYVQQTLSEWQPTSNHRVAGVSSFGIGGTNAHVIIEEATARVVSGKTQPWNFLTISAKSSAALEKATDNLTEFLSQHPKTNISDIAFTLQNGRKAFEYRQFFLAKSSEDALKLMQARNPMNVSTAIQENPDRPVTFMFPGQAAQYVNMGKEIYQMEASFRKEVDLCCELLRPHLGFDLLQVLYPAEKNDAKASEQLDQTAVTQPAMFVIEYAMAKLWMKWGLPIESMIGHSSGEYVSACLAGVFSLEDALTLIAARGRLMQNLPKGSMLAVRLTETEIQQYLNETLSLAVVNAPSSSVVAGPVNAIKDLQSLMNERKIGCLLLKTSHAFHSLMMEPIIIEFRALFNNVKLNIPKIPFISNLTGTWISSTQAIDPEYWGNHLRQTVRFADGISELLKEPLRILLEVGPGHNLTSLARQHPSKTSDHVVLSSFLSEKKLTSYWASMMNVLGRLWTMGVNVDWQVLYDGQTRRRISLPTYPFERQRYWIDTNPAATHVTSSDESEHTTLNEGEAVPYATDVDESLDHHETNYHRTNLSSEYVAPHGKLEERIAMIWQELLGTKKIGREDDFFELGGHSLLAARLFAQIEKFFDVRIPLAVFFQATTIEQIADILRQKECKTTWTSLVPIQSDGTRPPLFLIHGAEGNILLYRDLCRHLGHDQPVYGLQSQGLDGKTKLIECLKDMAASYVREIQLLQPEGPYYLGGYCMGGVVALEMAQQLHAQNQKVALLAFLETYNLQIALKVFSFRYRLFRSIQNIKFHLDNLLLSKSREGFSFFMKKAYVEISRIKTGFNVWLSKFAHKLNRSTEFPYPHVSVSKVNDKAMLEYIPREYPGCITLFRPYKDFAGMHDPQFGWNEIAKKGVDVHILPVNPHGMLVEPFARLLADKLKSCINQAESVVH